MANKNLSMLKKRFYRLRDEREVVLKSDLPPNERHRKAQAIQLQINAIARKFEEAARA